jgi:5'-nucleotidase
MNRRKFLQYTGTASGLLLANQFPIDAFGANNQSTKQLTILHTNDVHSRLDPFPMDGSKYEGMGGVANRKKMIDEIKQSNDNILLLDCGDIFQGTPYFNLYKGEPEIKAMTALGYDAGTIGNHDFDGGIENLATQLVHANFPLVNCNYDFTNTPLENKIPPYIIIKKNGLKIGIIGVGIQLKGLVLEEMYGNTKYNNPVPIANEYAHLLKVKKKCDMVICLSHLGYEYKDDKLSDRTFAPQTKHIDLILGGHTHTFLEQPFITQNNVGKQIIINQVGWAGIQLGCLQFDLFHQKDKSISLNTHNGIFIEKTSV